MTEYETKENDPTESEDILIEIEKRREDTLKKILKILQEHGFKFDEK